MFRPDSGDAAGAWTRLLAVLRRPASALTHLATTVEQRSDVDRLDHLGIAVNSRCWGRLIREASSGGIVLSEPVEDPHQGVRIAWAWTAGQRLRAELVLSSEATGPLHGVLCGCDWKVYHVGVQSRAAESLVAWLGAQHSASMVRPPMPAPAMRPGTRVRFVHAHTTGLVEIVEPGPDPGAGAIARRIVEGGPSTLAAATCRALLTGPELPCARLLLASCFESGTLVPWVRRALAGTPVGATGPPVAPWLLAQESRLARGAEGRTPTCLVVLARRSDLEAEGEVVDALLALATRCSRALLVLCPPESPAHAGGDVRWVRSRLGPGAAVHVEELFPPPNGPADASAAFRRATAAIPFSDATLACGAIHAIRASSTGARPRPKLLAVDCDNTLWDGVCGEVGPRSVRFERHHIALQRRLQRLAQSGALVALITKNAEADVAAVLRERAADMALARDDLSAVAAGWGSKVEAVQRLLRDHGFAEDALAFVDDSPLECAEMAASLPAATVIPWPAVDAQACLRLLDLAPSLAVASTITEEDARRARLYAAQRARREAESKTAGGGGGREDGEHCTDATPRDSLKRFFHELGTSVHFVDIASRARADGGPEDASVQRAAQLSWRTNQFNPLKRPCTASQLAFRARQDPGWVCLGARVRDRFGDYGLVGVVAGATRGPGAATGPTANVDMLLLSCRALGRGVEHALLRAFVGAVSRAGGDCAGEASELVVHFEAADGARNEPCWLFLVREAGLRPALSEPSPPANGPSDRGVQGTDSPASALPAMPPPGQPCLLRGPLRSAADLRLTAEGYADHVLAEHAGQKSASSVAETAAHAPSSPPGRHPLLEALLATQAARPEVALALCQTLTAEITASNAARRRRRQGASPAAGSQSTRPPLSLGVGWWHTATRRDVLQLVRDREGQRWLRHPLLAGGVRCAGASEARFVASEVVARLTYTRPDLVPPLRTGGASLVLDIGANVGTFAAHVLHVRPGARILCAEPAPQLAPLLHATLVAARRAAGSGAPMMLDSAVGCVGDKVGDTRAQGGWDAAPPPLATTPLTFFPGATIVSGIGRTVADVLPAVSAHASTALSRMPPAARKAASAALQGAQVQHVPLLPLGLALSLLGEPEVDLLKVDVEGAELSVVQSLHPSQWSCVRIVVAEVHADQPGRLLAFLRLLLDTARFARVTVCEESADATAGDRTRVTVYASRAEEPLLGPQGVWECILPPAQGSAPLIRLGPPTPPFIDARVPSTREAAEPHGKGASGSAPFSAPYGGVDDHASLQAAERTVTGLAAAWNGALGNAWPVPPTAELRGVARVLCRVAPVAASPLPREALPMWAVVGFEEAGGDSLALLNVVSAARASGIPLPYRDGIGHMTLAEMAREALRAKPTGAEPAQRATPSRAPPPPATAMRPIAPSDVPTETNSGAAVSVDRSAAALPAAGGTERRPHSVMVLGPQRSPWPDLAHWAALEATAELPLTALVRTAALRAACQALRSSSLPHWAAPLVGVPPNPTAAWRAVAARRATAKPAESGSGSEPQSLRLVALASMQLIAGSAALEHVLVRYGTVPAPLCVAAHSAGQLAAPAFRGFSTWAQLLARLPTVLHAAAKLGALVDSAMGTCPVLSEFHLWSVQGADVGTVEAAVAAMAGEAEGAVIVRNGPTACGVATTSTGAAALRACLEPLGARIQHMEEVDAPYHAPALSRAIFGKSQSRDSSPRVQLDPAFVTSDCGYEEGAGCSTCTSGGWSEGVPSHFDSLLHALVQHGARWDRAAKQVGKHCFQGQSPGAPVLLLDVGPKAPTAAVSSLVKVLPQHSQVALLTARNHIVTLGEACRGVTGGDHSARCTQPPAPHLSDARGPFGQHPAEPLGAPGPCPTGSSNAAVQAGVSLTAARPPTRPCVGEVTDQEGHRPWSGAPSFSSVPSTASSGCVGEWDGTQPDANLHTGPAEGARPSATIPDSPADVDSSRTSVARDAQGENLAASLGGPAAAHVQCAAESSTEGSRNGPASCAVSTNSSTTMHPMGGHPPCSGAASPAMLPTRAGTSVDEVAAILLAAAREAVWKASGRTLSASALATVNTPWSSAALTSFEVTLACTLGSRRVNAARPLTPALWFASEAPLDLARRLVGAPAAPSRSLAARARMLPTREALCVEGMACVLPGGIESPAELWAALVRGDTLFNPRVPPGRSALLPTEERAAFYSGPDCGGTFLPEAHLAAVDTAAFRLSQGEAAGMDPQHRLCLRTAAEALQRAGVDTSASEVQGQRMGVFAAVHYSDYRDLALRHGRPLPPGAVAGSTPAGVAGMLSRWLGSVGPSVAVQAACASGLVAVHSAASALRQGDCDLAVVVAAQVNLSFVGWADLRASSVLAEAQCRPLAEGRGGMARGEGALALVLGPASRASRPGPPVACLRSSATAHAGPSSSLAAPSRRAQETLLRDALSAASMQPSDVTAVEGHFTGTAVGDAVELDALGAVFGGASGGSATPRDGLLLGAAKAQFGHLEAAAGLLGLVKACAALQRAAWPGIVHSGSVGGDADAPSPPKSRPALHSDVAWADDVPEGAGAACGLRVVAPRAVRSLRGRPVVGVSAFGITGTLAHVLVEADQERAHGLSDPGICSPMGSDYLEFWAAGSSCGGVAGALRRWARQVAAVQPGPALATAASALSRRMAPRGMPWRVCIRIARSFFDSPVGAARQGLRAHMAKLEQAASADAVEACASEDSRLHSLCPGVELQGRRVGQGRPVATALADLPSSCLCTDINTLGPDLLVHSLGAAGLALWRARAARIGRACTKALRAATQEEAALLRRLAAVACRVGLWLALSGSTEARLDELVDAETVLACAAATGVSSQRYAFAALVAIARGGGRSQASALCPEESGCDATIEATPGDAGLAVGDCAVQTLADLWSVLSGRRMRSASHDVQEKASWTLASALWLQGHDVPLRGPQVPSLAPDLVPPPGWDAKRAWVLADKDTVVPPPELALRRGQRRGNATNSCPVPTQTVLDCLANALPADRAHCPLSATESFTAQGLDSFGAVELAALLSQRTGTEVDPSAVFDHPTPQLLAQHLTTSCSVADSSQSRGNRAWWTGDAHLQSHPAPLAGTRGALVLGVGIRAPCGAHDVGSFWAHTLRGKRAPNYVPNDALRARYIAGVQQCKLPAAHFGAFLAGTALSGPGAATLGLSPTEYAATDPQHLLLLTCVQDALEQAGLSGLAPKPRGHHGAWPCRIGVFVGLTNADAYAAARREGADTVTAHTAVGTAPSLAAGRIAHRFDLLGPAVVVDTSCSSSLSALHLAMQSLRAGECEAAVVAGANAITDPTTTVSLARARALSPTGACHTLGPADGYLRAEAGVAMVVAAPHAMPTFERAAAASICPLGCVAGTAWSHDGRAAALTAPNGLAQEEVVGAALRDAGVPPEAVAAVELHGTGTPLGDGIEVEALARALDLGRSTVCLASTKAVWGHSEAAAGLLGAVAALCAQASATWHPLPDADAVAPRLLRRAISARGKAGKLQVSRHPTALGKGPNAVVGVSSFGMSGTNVHALFAPPPDRGRAARTLGLRGQDAPEWPERTRVSSPIGAMPTAAAGSFWDLTLRPQWEVSQPSTDRSTSRVQVVSVAHDATTPPQELSSGVGHVVIVPNAWRPPWEAVCVLRTAIARAEAAPRPVRVHMLCPELLAGDERPGGAVSLYQAIAAGTGAALRGVFLAAQREHAPVTGSAILCEVGPQDTLAARARELDAELEGLQPVVCWRRGAWLQLRLRVESIVAATSEWAMPGDAENCTSALAETSPTHADHEPLRVVVVTGASSGLARRCCTALAARVPRALFVMCSRRSRPHALRTPPVWGERWVQADLAGEAGPARVAAATREALSATPDSVLLGVLHASGVAEEASLRMLTPAAWDRHMAAKCGMLWALLRALDPVVPARQRVAPRVFALSSVASCWGNRGFGAYAAANAALDAAYRARRVQVSPRRHWIVNAVQFGAVGDAGMVADASHRRRFVAMGTGGLPVASVAAAAVDALLSGADDALSPGHEPAIVARLDPTRTLRVVEASSQRPWPPLADLAAWVQATRAGCTGRVAGAAPRPGDSVGNGGDSAVPSARSALADAAVAYCSVEEEEARRLLQQEETRLVDLGIDSLGAVELAEALTAALHAQHPVPHTLVYDHPTVGDAVAFLEGAVPSLPATQGGDARGTNTTAAPSPTAQSLRVPSPDMPSVLVSGAACCLPGGVDSPAAFAELLFSGQRAPLSAPPWLWRRDAFPALGDEAHDDTASPPVAALSERQVLALRWRELGLRRAEVCALSPQHRVALRLAVEAVVDSGTPLSSLRGSPCGVYVACCSHEHAVRAAQVGAVTGHTGRTPKDPDGGDTSGAASADVEACASWRPAVSAVDAVGDAPALIANRVSHALDLRGPSEVVDAACASGVAALHAAKRALRDGECDRAIVVGVNLLADPTAHVRLRASGALSASGRCDAICGGKGYGRAEGGVAFLLRRTDLTPAPRASPLATLCGTAIGQCGRGASLTAPRGSEQQRVVRAALRDAGAEARDVGLLVAHGTGTALGDEAEARAASAAFHGREQPVEVTACKAAVGHTEGCAGLVGVLHAVVALARGEAPPPPRGCAPAPPRGAVLGGAPLAFGAGAGHRPLSGSMAGVSSFGFGGTLSHAVLAPTPLDTAAGSHRFSEPACRVLMVPGQGQGARGALASVMRALPFARAFLSAAEAHISALLRITGEPGRVALAGHLVCGEGADAAACVPDAPLAVAEQLALCAAQVVAVEAMREIGVEWDCALGHSLGEVAAAVAAGALPWRDALSLALARARAIEACVPSGEGGLVAVAADAVSARTLARETGATISCFNGPCAHVLSGPRGVVRAVENAARSRGIRARTLAVTHAFHHPCLRPAQHILKRELARLFAGEVKCGALRWAPLRAALASTATGRMHKRGERLGVDHFAAQVPSPVLFADAARALDAWRGVSPVHVVDLGLGAGMTFLAQRVLGDSARTTPRAAANHCVGPTASNAGSVHWYPLFPRDATLLEQEVALRLLARSRLGRGADAAAGTGPVGEPWLTSDHCSAVLACLGLADVAQAEVAEQALDAAAASFLRSLAPPRPGTVSGLHRAAGKYSVAPAATQAARTPQACGASAALLRASRRAHPSVRPTAALLASVLQSADALQRGEVTGREVLFPGGSDALVRPVYASSPRARLLNAVVAAVVARESAHWGGEGRIAELGAGTGATSQCVHHALLRSSARSTPCHVMYTLTDLGGRFVAELARSAAQPPVKRVRDAIALLLDRVDVAASYSSSPPPNSCGSSREGVAKVTLRSARVDMNTPRAVRGLASDGPLHVVVAANALHAARKVDSTLRAIAAALAPGGLLVVREVMAPEPAIEERGALLDATFGLLDEWWRTDGRSVLLTPSEWHSILTASGFGDVAMLPYHPTTSARPWFARECVIVARRTAASGPARPSGPARGQGPRPKPPTGTRGGSTPRSDSVTPVAGAGREASPQATPYRAEAEDAVAKALADAVGCSSAPADRNMAQLGVDSLVSLSAASSLARILGVDAATALERSLPRQDWFAATRTPASLVARVAEAMSMGSKQARDPPAPLRCPTTAAATLLVVPHAGGVSRAFRHWERALWPQVSVRVAASPAELLLRGGEGGAQEATGGAAASASLDAELASAFREAAEGGALILYGHCLGGVRLLAALHRLGSQWASVLRRATLILSCCPAPWRLEEFRGGRLHSTATDHWRCNKNQRATAMWAIQSDLAAARAILPHDERACREVTAAAMRHCGHIAVVRAVDDNVVDTTHGEDLIAAGGSHVTVRDAPGQGHNWPLEAGRAAVLQLLDGIAGIQVAASDSTGRIGQTHGVEEETQ